MKKVIVYVDGFNFYHATKELPFPDSANVDLWSLASSLPTAGSELVAVKYFSAYAQWRPADVAKHKRYVSSLEQTGVQVTMAHFKNKYQRCPECGARWKTHEEKETDVRLALQIFADAATDLYDVAFILSGDSDMVPAIEMVKAQFPEKRLLMALPKHRFALARDMRRVTHNAVALATSRVHKHLFL